MVTNHKTSQIVDVGLDEVNEYVASKQAGKENASTGSLHKRFSD